MNLVLRILSPSKEKKSYDVSLLKGKEKVNSMCSQTVITKTAKWIKNYDWN